MKSPIHYHNPMGLTIDLSKLAEVSDAFFISHTNGIGWGVSFRYRYVEGEPINFTRALKTEDISFETRLRNFERKRRGEISEAALTEAEMIQLGYEMYEERDEEGSLIKYILLKGEDGKPWCEINLQKEVDQLIAAWVKWKAIEPEVYAIVRKHLS